MKTAGSAWIKLAQGPLAEEVLSAGSRGAGLIATLRFGLSQDVIDFSEDKLVGRFVGPVAAAKDPADSVLHAVLHPLDAPELHLACTPDDHVAVVLDPELPDAIRFVQPVLESLTHSAGIRPDRIAIVHPDPSCRLNLDRLIDDLPDEFADVQIVEHQPDNSESVAYLASTREGQRVYLNRAVVDADFVLVIAETKFDATTGRRGPASLLFPALSNAQTRLRARRTAMESRQSPDALYARQHCDEVARLAGLFYGLGITLDATGAVDRVWLGRFDSVQRCANEHADAHWTIVPLEDPPDLVVAVCSPVNGQSDWTTVGAAIDAAGQLLQPGGQIAVVSDLYAPAGPAAQILLSGDDPWTILNRTRASDAPDAVSAAQWARAISNSKLFLCSSLKEDLVESLNIAPIHSMHELENLIDSARSFYLLESADRVHVGSRR